ncbi:hypothetical protein OAS19_04435, partial [Altererythrobacter sp.]|nr:hypothetical protein [Altererythrobacter sp.]
MTGLETTRPEAARYLVPAPSGKHSPPIRVRNILRINADSNSNGETAAVRGTDQFDHIRASTLHMEAPPAMGLSAQHL